MSEEEPVYAIEHPEEVWGTIQCVKCSYWGRMDGFIQPQNKKHILFSCPECKSLVRVDNPEY